MQWRHSTPRSANCSQTVQHWSLMKRTVSSFCLPSLNLPQCTPAYTTYDTLHFSLLSSSFACINYALLSDYVSSLSGAHCCRFLSSSFQFSYSPVFSYFVRARGGYITSAKCNTFKAYYIFTERCVLVIEEESRGDVVSQLVRLNGSLVGLARE